MLCIYHVAAHDWQDSEIELTREVVTRFWTRCEHLRAVESLAAAKATLDLTLEAVQVGGWDLDVNNGTSRRSLHHDRCFGYEQPIPEAEWGFERFIQHVHPDDRAGVEEGFRHAATQQQVWRCECRIIWRDGSLHWIAVSGNIGRNEEGQPTRMQGIVADISERKRAEALQLAQKHTLELVLQDTPLEEVLETLVRTVEAHSPSHVLGAIMLLDGDGLRLRHGAAPTLPAEYSRAIDGVVIGPRAGSCGTAAYLKRPVYVTDIATDPLWENFKDLAFAHDLRACWSTPIVSGSGDVLGTFAMYYHEPREANPADLKVVDMVTRTAALVIQRRQDQDRLRESEARFRAIADNVPHLAWMTDGNGSFDWFNRRWLEYTGTTLADNLGTGWKRVHHPDHLDAMAEKFERHLREGKEWEDTFPLRGKDGEYRWFLSRMSVIRDETGKVMRFFGTNTDVTEQRQMAEDLQRLTVELSHADRRKDEFLATLAHELRNPLAPLSNSLELLKRARGNTDVLERAQSTMERQVKQMVRLIDDLLDVSRITCNKLALKKARVELASLVQHAVDACRPCLERSRLQLDIALPVNPIYLHADAARLAQVFGNLLNNACKFTPAGGLIQLSAELDEREVTVRIKDNGVGIPTDRLSDVFSLFTQLDRPLEQSEGGLGIGLSLVQRLVQMHDGTVTGHSEGPGHGSEFVVHLPALIEPAAQVLPSAAPPDGASLALGRRILVVDDNHDSAESLAMLLNLAGNSTQIAHDGLEAIHMAQTSPPDLILLDIGLPKMNGYDACRAIRKQPKGKNIRLVALTGWGQDEDRRKTSEAGFDAHMVKPVDHAALMTLLASLPSPEAG